MPRYIGAYRGGVRPSAPTLRLPTLHFVLDLSFRGREAPVGIRSPFHINGGLGRHLLCRSAAKARFDNRQPPKGVSKEGGPQPSLFGRSRMGDFQGGRKIETSFPLEWRFWLLLSLLTKVTRRRQKRARTATGRLLSQHLLYFALPINPNTAGLQHLRRHAVPLGQRPGKRAVIDAPAPAGRASLLQHRRRAAI